MNGGERRISLAAPASVRLTALAGVPMVGPGDDLADIVLAALAASRMRLRDGDVVVLARKIVSKAQGRFAGIDRSTIGGADDTALLLPQDPDATCAQLREALHAATGASVGVVINDSHGRAFRDGTVGVAIGAAGIAALADLRGAPDLHARHLQSTEVALADEIASAASLLMGRAAEGWPIVLARGLANAQGSGCATDLVRPGEIDLFRSPAPAEMLEFIGGRRSIRRYTDVPVADETVERILSAAASAPSAHNRQPWRFAVLRTASARKRLAEAMGARLAEDRGRDGDAVADIEADVARSIARIAGAPVAILVCMAMEDMDGYADPDRAEAEHLMAVQSTAMAMQNLQLAAHAHGLGACIMCAPLFCQDTARAALDLPAAWEPQALITLGVPANAGKPFRRRPSTDIVRVVD